MDKLSEVGNYLSLLDGEISGTGTDPITGETLERSMLIPLYRKLIFHRIQKGDEILEDLMKRVRSVLQIPPDIHDEMLREAHDVIDKRSARGSMRAEILQEAESLGMIPKEDLVSEIRKGSLFGLGGDYFEEADSLVLTTLMDRDEIEHNEDSINSLSEAGMKKYQSGSIFSHF